MRIFISHSSSDGILLARQTASIIKNAGHEPWIFEHNKTPGALVWKEIADCIVNKSQIFYYLCTANSNGSWGQAQEAGYALNNRKRMVVVVLDGATVPLELTARWYERVKPEAYPSKITDIAQNLRKISNSIRRLDPRVRASSLTST